MHRLIPLYALARDMRNDHYSLTFLWTNDSIREPPLSPLGKNPSELFNHFTLPLHRRGIRELAASL